jgi:hypothetical protein
MTISIFIQRPERDVVLTNEKGLYTQHDGATLLENTK